MSKSQSYFLVSLPTSISPSNSKDEAFQVLQSAVQSDHGTTYPFSIPAFKIGTLDALVQQADDLSKLNSACEGAVNKVGDSLRGLLEGDEEKIVQQKTINDKPIDQYLQSFSWNRVKYRADKPLVDLIDALQKDVTSIDNDVKAKFQQHNQVKSNLIASQRKQTGNLSTRSLASIVDPSLLITDSDYLETHLLAIPNTSTKEFLRSYETLSPMVVPRSSVRVAADDEFALYAVVTFKKHSAEFLHKCRERRWTPRDFKYKEGGKEEEQQEMDRLAKEERKLWGEALRLGRTGYSESAMVWVHVLALRVFVETVLRYGLPLEFVCGLVKTNPKVIKKAKANLDTNFSYLGGNAFGKDKKGRVQQDTNMGPEVAGMQGTEDFTAYVYYEFEIS